ncbi:DUF3500 domain-containing protein [Algoriphagus halophilus]|uniref:DUF3500 domain-containing protein n=1 Tax=Algoriphagus halophilus TaxID=226505 RepID=A0A1N6DNF6_9BACT|nr:DUF3500 domain-containing protein [Algoriphagus halophilus]SIN72332.1 Protein of unknown function [Algoriphagus halophilus]
MKKIVLVGLLIFSSIFLAFILLKDDPASKFLNSMSQDQKQKVLYSFDDETKTQWHYIPSSMFPRAGISLAELDITQKKLLHELLQSSLSETGYLKTIQIMDLENVLREMSGDSVMRDPDKFFVAFYGNPETDSLWSWSFEGHHISLNFTVLNNEQTIAPRFFGANPAVIPSGPRKGEKTLEKEEELGFQLVNSLDQEQKAIAIFQEAPINDIVTRNSIEVDPLSPEGIKFEVLNSSQKKVFLSLIDEYLSTMPEKLAMERMKNIQDEELGEIRFGWAGTTKSGEGHYYRIQGKSFLIEFDNTQTNANHIHTVWRDFNGDFGKDLIKEHYENSDHHTP